jgi:hypothetical protein
LDRGRGQQKESERERTAVLKIRIQIEIQRRNEIKDKRVKRRTENSGGTNRHDQKRE